MPSAKYSSSAAPRFLNGSTTSRLEPASPVPLRALRSRMIPTRTISTPAPTTVRAKRARDVTDKASRFYSVQRLRRLAGAEGEKLENQEAGCFQPASFSWFTSSWLRRGCRCPSNTTRWVIGDNEALMAAGPAGYISAVGIDDLPTPRPLLTLSDKAGVRRHAVRRADG